MWNQKGSCVYYVPSRQSEQEEHVQDDSATASFQTASVRAMAGFDLDSTLTISKSGRQFTLDADDTIWAFDSVPEQLKNIQDEGFTIVIFTNQARFSTQVKDRIECVRQALEQFGVVVFVFIATGDDDFRKPETGMFELFKSLIQIEDTNIFSEMSFYVGDAAGDEQNKSWSDYPPYAWASSDLEFAEHCGLLFFVPRDIFPQPPEPLPTPNQEVVLLVGNQGSNKSTTCTNFAALNPKYVVISQDVYKTKARVVKEMISQLKSGKSVIIDRTNPSSKDRAEWIGLAKDVGNIKSIRIWWFARDGRPFNELRPEPVSKICYNIYSKNFEMPTEEEGKNVGISTIVERIN